VNFAYNHTRRDEFHVTYVRSAILLVRTHFFALELPRGKTLEKSSPPHMQGKKKLHSCAKRIAKVQGNELMAIEGQSSTVRNLV